jgi:hypothetical protein
MGAPMMQETTETNAASTPAAPRTDRLELVKELGRGSIGVVHKARNPQLERVIALRQFEVPQWLDDVNDLLKRILSEARGASALDHANIAKLYTCGYRGFTVFMTSEFIEGKSLKELMASGSLDLPEILALAKQLLAALDYAHEKGVFHHFLNLSNIKVLPDGTLKVLDFGLLKDKHLLSQTPAKRLENEPYLSPEQVKNKPPDRSANLFSAATILYELYTARNPFAGMHLGEVDRAIVDVTPHPLNMAHPRVPTAISAVILKGLSKAPAERYPSGKQFAAALEDAMKAEPVRAAAAPAKPLAGATAQPAAPSASIAQPPTQRLQDTATTNGAGPATARVAPLRPPTAARAQVGSMNQWKLVGAVVGCLFIVALLAYLFERKPTEVADSPGPPPVASSNPQKASTPAPAPAPATIEPEAVAPEPLEPLEPLPAPSQLRRGKNARSLRRVAAASVATTPAQGQITVSSTPADATVEIEGLNQSWRTPQTIGSLAPGTYKVTVSKPGYASEVRNVQVSAGNRFAVEVRLTVTKGFLNIAGSPASASVLIDGKDTGKVTPATFMLDPAAHHIVLRKSGYLDSGTDIQLAAGQTVGYSPSLMVAGRTDNIKVVGGGIGKVFGGGGSSQGKARIEIKSDPKGAQVLINGTPLPKTTPVEVQVEAGNYDITLQKDGYKAVHENAIVGIEDRVKIDRTLSR